ncbi:MAG: hypothetical protein HY913_11475 [Desulfomonile tiedjei]|nr:hypothetical protein [Desulfomonile tiedjei]
MEQDYFGFNLGQVVVGLIRVMKQRGVLEEKEILDILWDAKEPMFPWDRQEIKELLKL